MKRIVLFLLFCAFLSSCAKKLRTYSFTQPPAPVALAPRPIAPPTPPRPFVPSAISATPLPPASTPQDRYRAALEEIRQMLNGTKPLDFKRAVFVTENAYLDNRLDYAAFCQSITQLTQASQRLQTSLALVYS